MDLIGKFLALASALLWAAAIILFKRAGETIRPLVLNFYKTAVTALLLLPVLWLGPWPPLKTTDLAAVLLSGALGIALSDTMLFSALNRLGAGLTAIVDCTYAPFVMLASWAMLRQSPSVAQIGGAILVAAAVAMTALTEDHRQVTAAPRRLILGLLAGLGANALMAVSIALMQPVLTKAPVLWVTELRVLAALAILAPLLWLGRGRRAAWLSLNGRSAWRHALPGALIGNVLAMTLWVAAFKFTAVNSAAILNQTNTVMVVVLASLWLGEPFTRPRLAGALLAFAGAVLILLG